MSLSFTHKPNYFLFAQLLMHHIQQHIQKHPHEQRASFDLDNIHTLFYQDTASATTNLDGIMNITDEYKVETLAGDRKIITHYEIDPRAHKLHIQFDPEAMTALAAGKRFIEPDASIHE